MGRKSPGDSPGRWRYPGDRLIFNRTRYTIDNMKSIVVNRRHVFHIDAFNTGGARRVYF